MAGESPVDMRMADITSPGSDLGNVHSHTLSWSFQVDRNPDSDRSRLPQSISETSFLMRLGNEVLEIGSSVSPVVLNSPQSPSVPYIPRILEFNTPSVSNVNSLRQENNVHQNDIVLDSEVEVQQVHSSEIVAPAMGTMSSSDFGGEPNEFSQNPSLEIPEGLNDRVLLLMGQVATSMAGNLDSVLQNAQGYTSKGNYHCECGCGRSYIKKDSVEYFQSHLLHHIHSGASVTSFETIIDKIEDTKVDGHVQRDILNKILKKDHEIYYPKPNFLPPSLHMVQRVLDVKTSQDVMHHVCDAENCSGHVWPNIKVEDYEKHKHDRCPNCGSERFTTITNTCGAMTYEPKSYMFYFGLHESVRSLFNEPGFPEDIFCDSRISEQTQPGSFFLGTEAQRIVRALGAPNLFNDPSILRFQLMIDWYNPYKGSSYSLGLISLKCTDVSSANLGKTAYTRPLVVIPGPSMPPNLSPYFAPILEGFADPLHEESKCKVSLPNGSSATITMILEGLLADTPARNKCSLWLGVNAHVHCGWCLHEGTTCEHTAEDGRISRTVYYKGYHAPVLHSLASSALCCGRPEKDQVHGKKFRVGDALLYLTDEEQVARAQLFEEGKHTSSELGCKGMSFFINKVHYLSYNNFFIVPIAHALLYGVVKKFIEHLFRPIRVDESGVLPWDIIPQDKRKDIERRAKDVHVPSDFGKTYRDIKQYKNGYTMEEWLHFVETFSAYILQGCLHKKLLELWLLLVEVVDHYMRPYDYANQREFLDASEHAAESLYKFACKLEQEKFPDSMFTYNLHMLVCRLHKQELARGAAHKELEFVVERCIQDAKSLCGRKHVNDPDKVLANAYLWKLRIGELKALLGLSKSHVSLHAVCSNESDVDIVVGGCQMLGTGKVVTKESDIDQIHLSVSKWMLDSSGLTNWSSDLVLLSLREKMCYAYDSALCDQDVLVAEGKGKAKLRTNAWAVVNYVEDGTYVIHIKNFVKIAPPFDAAGMLDLQPLRLAICSMYDKRPLIEQRLLQAPQGVPRWPNYAVKLEHIGSKMVAFHVPGAEHVSKYFMPCKHLTKRRKV